MARIIIAGYPKSGNTWLCRMIAESIEASFVGFFSHGKIEPDEGAEGLERKNPNFAIFKSHHTFHELQSLINVNDDKIIMIHRNPLDIAASGIAYFSTGTNQQWYSYGSTMERIMNRMNLSIQKAFPVLHHRMTIIYSICYGSQIKNEWFRHSWTAYNQEFIGNPDVIHTSYEKLKSNPSQELSTILKALDITVNASDLTNAIQNQSIDARRTRAGHLNSQEKIIRNGKVGASTKELSYIERLWMRAAIGPMLRK